MKDVDRSIGAQCRAWLQGLEIQDSLLLRKLHGCQCLPPDECEGSLKAPAAFRSLELEDDMKSQILVPHAQMSLGR